VYDKTKIFLRVLPSSVGSGYTTTPENLSPPFIKLQTLILLRGKMIPAIK
jgi:hypothetical protein